MPTETFEDAWQRIEDYETGWLIEEYHKVLKTVCGMEIHSVCKPERLEPINGVNSILGARLFQRSGTDTSNFMASLTVYGSLEIFEP